QVIRADRHLRRSTARGKRGAGRIRPGPLRSEELTGVVAEYSAQLPAARDRLQHAPAAGKERTSLTERKLIHNVCRGTVSRNIQPDGSLTLAVVCIFARSTAKMHTTASVSEP